MNLNEVMVLAVEQLAQRRRSDHENDANVGRGERRASPSHAQQEEHGSHGHAHCHVQPAAR